MSEKKQRGPKEYIEEDLRSIVKAAALMSTAMNEGRIVEANGWLKQIKQACGSIDDNLEELLQAELEEKLGLEP
jgi:uncharacterized protein YjgD (DUF1641 family)